MQNFDFELFALLLLIDNVVVVVAAGGYSSSAVMFEVSVHYFNFSIRTTPMEI